MNIQTKYAVRQCAECGTTYTPQSSRSKYCAGCVMKVRRRQTAERARQYRARIKEAGQSWQKETTS